MDNSLEENENNHKKKPTQFLSFANGVRKRFEGNLKENRISRRNSFDSMRNLPKSETLVQARTKKEQRMIQLQKWKEEKEKKKKELMLQKKKPFLVGTVKASLKYEAPPPVPLPKPGPSRSASDKLYSFAPENAAFNPKLYDLPMVSMSTFKQPYEKTTQDSRKPESRKLRSSYKASKQTSTSSSNESHEDEMTFQKNKNTTRKITKLTGKTTKPKKLLTSKDTKSSSTSTDKNVENHPNTKSTSIRKPIETNATPIINITSEMPDLNTFTPLNRVPKSESSSEEKLRSPKSDVPIEEPIEELARGKENTREELKDMIYEGLDEATCVYSVKPQLYKSILKANIASKSVTVKKSVRFLLDHV